MAIQFLNGYKQFAFYIYNPLTDEFIEKIEYDLKHQAMREYLTFTMTEHEDISNVIHQNFKNVKYIYGIDNTALLSKENMTKYNKLFAHIINNMKILFEPHIDAYTRAKDEVVLLTSGGKSERIEFSNYVQNEGSPGHKGFALELISKRPWSNINWVDTEAQQTIILRTTFI